MALSFAISVAVNNLIALKNFRTFLFNHVQHNRTTFVERWLVERAKGWIERRAWLEIRGLMLDPMAQVASVTLNDVDAAFFAVLYICQYPQTLGNCSSGKELFDVLSQMELEFARLKRPNIKEVKYENPL